MPPIQRNDEKSSRRLLAQPDPDALQKVAKMLAAAVSDKTETIRDRASVCGCQLESFMAIGRRRIRGGGTGRRSITETSAASDARSYRSLVKTTKFRCHQFWVRVRQSRQRAAYAVPMLGLASGRPTLRLEAES